MCSHRKSSETDRFSCKENRWIFNEKKKIIFKHSVHNEGQKLSLIKRKFKKINCCVKKQLIPV